MNPLRTAAPKLSLISRRANRAVRSSQKLVAMNGETGRSCVYTTRRQEKAGVVITRRLSRRVQEGGTVDRSRRPRTTTPGQRTTPLRHTTRVARFVTRSACMCVSARRPMGSRARVERRSRNQFEAEAWEEGRSRVGKKGGKVYRGSFSPKQ